MKNFGSTSVIVDALKLGLTALAIFGFLYILVVRSFWIPTPSMVPTIVPGDRVLAEMVTYRFRRPKPGDIVVIKAPPSVAAEADIFAKRVVATGGRVVQISEGRLYVDGKLVPEPYVVNFRNTENFGPYMVPKGSLFLMGDNRPNSKDSRFFGPIEEDQVVGRVILTYWPLPRFGNLR